MTAPQHPRDRDDDPFVCQVCAGPCRSYKGSIRGWTCSRCLDAALGLTDNPEQTALPMGPLISRKNRKDTA